MAVVRRNDPERRNVDLCLFRSGADLGFRPNEDGLYQLVLRGLDRANKCVLAAGMNDGRAHGLQRLTPGNQLEVAVFAPQLDLWQRAQGSTELLCWRDHCRRGEHDFPTCRVDAPTI